MASQTLRRILWCFSNLATFAVCWMKLILVIPVKLKLFLVICVSAIIYSLSSLTNAVIHLLASCDLLIELIEYLPLRRWIIRVFSWLHFLCVDKSQNACETKMCLVTGFRKGWTRQDAWQHFSVCSEVKKVDFKCRDDVIVITFQNSGNIVYLLDL